MPESVVDPGYKMGSKRKINRQTKNKEINMVVIFIDRKITG